MLRSSLGAVALAASASAFLLPSTVSLERVHNGDGLVDPFTSLLLVECGGCLYGQRTETGLDWVENVKNNLFLNVSVGSNPETLELNGVQFYPPIMTLTSEPNVPYVAQVPADVTLTDIREKASTWTSGAFRLTSWSFMAGSAHTVNESGEEILSINLQLKALEQHPINVPDIAITCLKNLDGQLMILDTKATEPQSPEEECKGWPLLCKWRAIVADRIQSMRSKFRGKCSKRPHMGIMSGHKGGKHMEHKDGKHMDHKDGGHKQHKERPNHHHHHSHSHGKNAHRGRVLRNIFLGIVIPIMIGILAGLLTYLVGLVVGMMIAFILARLRRRNAYTPVALDEESGEERSSIEKQDYEEKELAEAPPQYVEMEADEVERK